MATTAETLRRTNEKAGTRAVLRNLRTSAYKVREVLDLIRGQEVGRAQEILQFCQRGSAVPVGKLLASAIANAENNDELDGDELFVSACFADEGTTMKRFRPRARGRAGRIRKRSCHVTIIVSRLPEDRLERLREEQASEQGSRRRRVAASRSRRVAASQQHDHDHDQEDETVESQIEETETKAVEPEVEVTASDKPEVNETAGDTEAPVTDRKEN